MKSQSPLHFLFELDKNIASNWDLYLITILTILLGTIFYFRRPPQNNHRDHPRSQETTTNNINTNANTSTQSVTAATSSTSTSTSTTTSTSTNSTTVTNSSSALTPPSLPHQSSQQPAAATEPVNSDQ